MSSLTSSGGMRTSTKAPKRRTSGEGARTHLYVDDVILVNNNTKTNNNESKEHQGGRVRVRARETGRLGSTSEGEGGRKPWTDINSYCTH